ncbi:MAG TPA: hypothetical protein VFB32_15535 [Rudaea sp.]|nr:hypothetical protein [Rudaea sp.]
MFKQGLALRVGVTAFVFGCAGYSVLGHAQAAPSEALERVAAARQAATAELHALAPQATAKKLGGAVAGASNGAQPDEAFVNPTRAYPNSCFADGLPVPGQHPQSSSDPAPQSFALTLPGDPVACVVGDTAECNYTESDTVTVWRVACSAGTSATLLEIRRPTSSEGNTTLYPTFPTVLAKQDSNQLYIRIAQDPSTIYSTVYPNTPIIHSAVYLLENVYAGSTQFNYNKAFSLTIDNATVVSLPDYSASSYAASSQPLPISGYMSTIWTNPAQNGEGMTLQVYDDYDGYSRTLAFAWYTYDSNHRAFWLYGQTSFPIGTTQISAPTVYYNNGTFGATGTTTTVPSTSWGLVTFSFPDCAHMAVSWNGNASAVNGPTGHGGSTFTRVADVNGIVCQ